MGRDRKTILITGATSGIGRATAMQLAAQGHEVVIVGRSQEKCIATVSEIYGKTGQQVHWILADLALQANVRRLAADFKTRFDRLDVLINNAGAVYIDRAETADGIEMGWAVNYFQGFLLTQLLLEMLTASTPARIVNLSSSFHWAARLNLKNIQERGLYIGWNVYARTKLACIYFTYELARRLEDSGVTANAIHPGLVVTGMGKTSGWLLRSVFGAVDLFAVPAEVGGESLVNLAVSPDLAAVSGKYFSGKRLARSLPVSYNREVARQLWELSCRMTGFEGQKQG